MNNIKPSQEELRLLMHKYNTDSIRLGLIEQLYELHLKSVPKEIIFDGKTIITKYYPKTQERMEGLQKELIDYIKINYKELFD